nr:hypothetical protein [Tatlockia sp.]
ERIGTVEQINIAQKLWKGAFANPDELSEYYKIMSPLYFSNREQALNPPASIQNIPYNVELVNFAFTTFLFEFNYTNQLAQIKAETLLFSGKNDWIIDKNEAEILHDGIKNSILIILDNCSYFPWKDQRFEFLKHVQDFIENKQG